MGHLELTLQVSVVFISCHHNTSSLPSVMAVTRYLVTRYFNMTTFPPITSNLTHYFFQTSCQIKVTYLSQRAL